MWPSNWRLALTTGAALVVAVVVSAPPARGDAVEVTPVKLGKATPAKLGTVTVTATPCTVQGEALVYSEASRRSGLVTTPRGEVVVFDDASRLRRYRARPGKGCALVPDRSFGKAGVLDVGVATADYPALAVDSKNTVYVSVSNRVPVRVQGNKAKPQPMCGDDTRVNASALSDVVWRYRWATKATRQRGDCSGAESAYLEGWSAGASELWVLDERAVAYGQKDGKDQLLVYGPDGVRAGQLALPDPGRAWSPKRIARCGAMICAVDRAGKLQLWDSAGKLLGSVALETLVGAAGSVVGIDVDGAAGVTYLLLRANSPPTDERFAGAVFRLDGLPR